MRKRYLTVAIEELALRNGKIALVSGPRQCGKTTLSKMLLRERGEGGAYRNWDDVAFRRLWARDPKLVVPESVGRDSPLLVLDEIHKDRRWKSRLKGLYDTLETRCRVLVTGSARLAVYRKGSDSLLGRYLGFRLHPFSLREMRTATPGAPDDLVEAVFARTRRATGSDEANLDALMAFGPFPEPLFARDVRRARLWRRTRTELLIREDLRDLSRIPELSRIELMAALLPEKVGSLFSMSSLREDLEVSTDTVKRWLGYLRELYYLFEVKPWTKHVARSLRKGGKLYFWDFSEVRDEAARFENLVACHLLKACHFWTDTGEGTFDLFYLRTKEKREIDFLVVRDQVPWLPVEVKLTDTRPSASWRAFVDAIPCRRAVQVVRPPAFERHAFGDTELAVVGAAEFLSHLV